MGIFRGPNIVTDGLLFAADAGSTRSYPGTGTTITPLVGSVDGTLLGSVGYSTGSPGVAWFDFDGPTTYDRISIPDTVTHTTGQSFSYDVWVYFDTLSGYDKTIVGKVGCNVGLIQASSSIRMQVYGPNGPCASGNVNYTAVSGTVTGEWQYWTGTYEVGVGVALYKNGDLMDSVAYTGNIGNYPTTLFAGGSINANYAMNGRISAFKSYNKTLSAAEVLQNFNAQKDRFGL